MNNNQADHNSVKVDFNVFGGDALNPDKPTFVITHGFKSDGNVDPNRKCEEWGKGEWVEEMANTIKDSNPDANVIVVDWEEGAKANSSIYGDAANNTTNVGMQLGQELFDLKVDPQNTQLIGHSLGAQISGVAGEHYSKLKRETGEDQKINSIVALDPAGPKFESDDFHDDILNRVNNRLDSSDAENVIALHSSQTFGHDPNVGSLDLYVNEDSKFQPDSLHAVENHGYAHQLFIGLLKGDVYLQPNGTILSLETLYKAEGSFNVDTESFPATKRPFFPVSSKIKFENKEIKIGEIRDRRETIKEQWEGLKEQFEYMLDNPIETFNWLQQIVR